MCDDNMVGFPHIFLFCYMNMLYILSRITVYTWTLLLVIYDVANYSEYENVQFFISIQITIGHTLCK